jgi:hypothetical protein
MSYLGRDVDKISNIEKLDNITFDGSSSYTLQKSSTNFVPSSANAILLSIDGVVQSGNFTVSGSTIDFGTAVAGTSTCNFILHLGVGLITAPADNGVTTAKIADDAVTEAKLNLISTSSVPSLEAKGDGSSQDGYIQLNCSQNSHGIKLKSPPHSAGQSYTLTFPQSISADTFLKTDGSGNLSFASAGGITEADLYRHTTSLTISSETTVTAWERPDDQSNSTNTFAYIGTGMSHSSGTFTFPSTGIYLVRFIAKLQWVDTNAFYGRIYGTKNNSSYDKIASADSYGVGGYNNTVVTETFFDVTDVSNDKIQFRAGESSNCNLLGNTDFNQTTATFIRLGDT